MNTDYMLETCTEYLLEKCNEILKQMYRRQRLGTIRIFGPLYPYKQKSRSKRGWTSPKPL